jgi:hypothetical protein
MPRVLLNLWLHWWLAVPNRDTIRKLTVSRLQSRGERNLGKCRKGNSGDGLGVEQWGCRKARDGMHSPIELLRRMEGQRGLYRVRILVEDTAGEGITGR